MNPADAAAQTGRLLGKAIDANRTAAPNPTPGALDIWTQTYAGVVQNAQKENPGPALGGLGLLPEVLSDYTENFADRGQSLSQVGTGMGQQLTALADQAKNLLHGGDGPPPEGVLGHFGAAMGLLTSLEQLVCNPIAAIPTPALPAVRVTDLDIGVPHSHAHPPNVPGPGALPSVGPVIPIPYVSGAGTVLINGLPAARCGDMGLGVFCGGFFPMFEIFLGSSSVWLEGARAARVGTDITKHCIFSNPKSIVKASDLPIGPSLGTLVGSSPNVLIGGFPLPSLAGVASGAMFKGLFKGVGKLGKLLAKTKGGAAAAAGFQRAASKTGGVLDSLKDRFGKKKTRPPLTGQRLADANARVQDVLNSKKLIIDAGADWKFAGATYNDLLRIADTDTGKKLLDEIKAGRHPVTIERFDPKVGYNGNPPGWDGPHTNNWPPGNCDPKVGSPSVIRYDPYDRVFNTPGSPSDSILLHEMAHAKNASDGRIMSKEMPPSKGPIRDRLWENRWSNLEEHDVINNYDNPYRREQGLPERKGHQHLPR